MARRADGDLSAAWDLREIELGGRADIVENHVSGPGASSSRPLGSLARVNRFLVIGREAHGVAPNLRIWQFGELEYDEALVEIRRNGEPVALPLRSVELLRYLIEHRDRVVPKRELLDHRRRCQRR